MKLKTLWFVWIPLAIGACTTQWQLTQEPSVWEQVCADVAAEYEIVTCEDYDAPEVITNSILMEQTVGAYGVFVGWEWRIYLASKYFLSLGGLTEKIVSYHEMVHAVLYKELPNTSRCDSERAARVMTDKKFGTNSATNGWEITYRCTSPSSLL